MFGIRRRADFEYVTRNGRRSNGGGHSPTFDEGVSFGQTSFCAPEGPRGRSVVAAWLLLVPRTVMGARFVVARESVLAEIVALCLNQLNTWLVGTFGVKGRSHRCQ